jgi:osmotically-inducible protein OsmY
VSARTIVALGVVSLLLLEDCASFTPRSQEEVQADAAISARVYDAIKANPKHLYPALDVTVRRGVVYLTGLAADPAGFDEATAIARGVPGVKGVANAMELTAGHL